MSMGAAEERSLSTVLGDIVGNIQQIVRAEVRLAKTEVQDEIQKIGSSAAMLGVAAIAAVLGLGVLLLACVYGLSTVMAPWAAALVVAVATLAVAGIAASIGVKRLRQVRLPPPKTVRSIEETMKWTTTQVK